jgi:succinate dehydrogenase (ubiquinone) cytochrome b560 subunit
MALQLVRKNGIAMRPMMRLMSSSAKKAPYSERMAAKGRPVSPNVEIYAFPIAAVSSITNRVTGVVLTVGATGIAAMSIVGVDVASLMMTLGNSAIGPVFKFSVAFPLLYHYLGGVRHVYWDKKPETINNESVEKLSQALFGAAAVGAVGAALYSTEKKA